MPITLVNLPFNISNLLGVDFEPRHTKPWIETNVASGVLIDADGNTLRLGDARVTLAADGTGSFAGLVPTNAATNPTGFQYQVHVDYARSSNGKRARWSSGWFSLTATTDLADVVAAQYVPPTWMTTATATLQGYVDEGEAIRDSQVDISGISTSDGVVEALVKNTGGAGPLTSAALNAAIADVAVPSPVTGASPLRAGRLALGRPLALTQGGNYSAFGGITQAPSGRLVVCYRSATGHLSTDGKIVTRYSDDKGATWTAEATAVPNATGSDKRDPTLSATSLGLTMTYFTWDGTTATGVYYVTSQDEGQTWGAPVALPMQFAGGVQPDAVTAPMIELANGDLLVPIYGRGTGVSKDTIALISTNDGGSWTPFYISRGSVTGLDTEEPYVQQLADGSLLALLRVPSSGYAYKVASSDNGRTWTAPVQAFAAGDGRNAFCETSDGTLVVTTESPTSPYRPALRASYDGGATWTAPQLHAVGAGGNGYGQVVETSPGVVALLQSQDGHSNKSSANFRYLTVGPRVTPLGDAGSLRLPQVSLTFPTGLLAYDTFNRADEANFDYSLADSGHEWRITSGGLKLVNGELQHSGGSTYLDSRATVDVGTGDVDITAGFKWLVGDGCGIQFRYADPSNYLRVRFEGSSMTRLQKVDAGVAADLDTYTTNLQGGWHKVRVISKNINLRVSVDDELILSYDMTGAELTKYGSNALHGLFINKNDQRVRSFYVCP